MEGINMAIDFEKRKQFDDFMAMLQPDDVGLDMSSLYGIYLAVSKNKDIIYTSSNIRLLIEKDKSIKWYSFKKTEDSTVRKYKIKPILFNYLSEKSERGEKARKLYKAMLAYRSKNDVSLKEVIKNAKETEKMLEKECDFTIETVKNDTRASKKLTYEELNKTISKLAKQLPAAKLIALGHIKKVYDTVKVPKKFQEQLDYHVRNALYTIRSSHSIEEIKFYRNKFDKDIDGIRIVKKEKKK
jgi:hypothetical protein